MPSVPNGKLEKYTQVEESKYECKTNKFPFPKTQLICIVDWADLVTLDLSKFDQPGGKQQLANQLKDAVHKGGTATQRVQNKY